MKFEEMNENEMTQVNGGFLGLNNSSGRRNSSGSEFVGLGGFGLNFSDSSTRRNGSSESSSFGLNLSNLFGSSNSSQG